MAKTDLGKKFEAKFKQDWTKTVSDSLAYRLADQMTGYKETSGNPCDFFCYVEGKLFMVECKEHKGASIPFTAIPQYERQLQYKGISGVYPGVVVWFSEKDKVYWVSIDEMEKMVESGEKSIGIRMADDESYNIVELPSVKKRTFMDTDYMYLVRLMDEK